MIDEVGLICNSSHCPTADMEKEGTFARYKEAGCDYIVIPWMSYGGHNQRLQENLDLMYKLCEEAKKAGIELNRKVLSDMAINDAEGFAKLAELAKANLK